MLLVSRSASQTAGAEKNKNAYDKEDERAYEEGAIDGHLDRQARQERLVRPELSTCCPHATILRPHIGVLYPRLSGSRTAVKDFPPLQVDRARRRSLSSPLLRPGAQREASG